MFKTIFKAVFVNRLLPTLLLFALPAVVQAQFTFTTNNDGSLTITGDTNISVNGSVTIPDTINGLPVTTIGTNAFNNIASLTNVTIGTNVTSIEYQAFLHCTSLTNVTVPDRVTNIGDGAFNSCQNLTSFHIPTNATSLGDGVFGGCSSLMSITIPDSVTSLGNGVFGQCSSLMNVTIPDSVTNLGNGVFGYCSNLTNVTIPTNITSLGIGLFQNCPKLSNITIPSSVTIIGASAFMYCSSLTNVTIPNSVTTLGEAVFDECSGLTSVSIGTNVSSIGRYMFEYCTRLGTIVIPNSVTTIGSNAFFDCWNLTNVTFGNGVTSIESGAFYGCTNQNLTSIIIPDSVTSIGESAFLYCPSLTSVAVGDSVTNIGNNAFNTCSDLTGVYFRGNSPTPTNDTSVFESDNNATVYYLPGTIGWGTNFDGRPTALWKQPTISITNMPTGLSVSNAAFTVKGKASDSWQVANVLYSLNGAGWNNAVTTNNWTNWSAAIMLAPGTNTVAAYAVDPGGNASPIINASLFFVVTNQLQISITGRGTISPNYSNAWLEIGRNYSITSAPASGFVFTNWIVSTNWMGGATVTNKALQFQMEPNLTLQANFVNTNRPTLTITAPTSGQHLTNALAYVKGTATNIVPVAGVWFQLNGGTWNQPATSNNWTNWMTTVELQNATNTIKAYAVDTSGNVSTTNSVSFVSSNAFELHLVFTAVQPLATNGLDFALQLSRGLNGHIQVSTDLVDWVTLTNFIGTNNTINFRDSAATNFNQRYYRAVVP